MPFNIFEEVTDEVDWLLHYSFLAQKDKLTTPSSAAKYNHRCSPVIGLYNKGRTSRYLLRLTNIYSHFWSQENLANFHNILKKRRLWLANLEIDQDKVMILPVNL